MSCSRPKPSRRQFLKAAAVSAAPLIVSASALGRSRLAPSERVTVGLVGCGERGMQVASDFLKDSRVQITAVCDVQDRHYRERKWGQGKELGREPARRTIEEHYAQASPGGAYRGCLASSDFREICDRSDLDAIIVATPDHWHALVALTALQKGKDVYGEKPFTHTFAEGERLVREVAARKAIYQVGSQQRSDPEFRQAVEVVRNGYLGTIQRVEVGLGTGYDQPKGDPTVATPPKGLDYDLWCGPAPVLPYMQARHHRWWRGNRAYGGGVLMDWIGHHNDIAMWGLGTDRSGPLRVETVIWTPPHTDIYNTPVDYTIRSEYPGNVIVEVSNKHTGGTKFIGTDGWLLVNRGKLKASDPRWIKPDFDRGQWKAYFSPGHARNFVDGVFTRKECICPADIGHRSVTPGHLAYVSHKVGRPLSWNATKGEIVGDAESQKLLMALPYRSPWVLE
jgi:predicted dehydrogenase